MKEWQGQQNNEVTLTLTIGGVTTFRLKNDLIQTLQWVPNVIAVHERDWDMQSKLLMVDIQ